MSNFLTNTAKKKVLEEIQKIEGVIIGTAYSLDGTRIVKGCVAIYCHDKDRPAILHLLNPETFPKP